MGKLEDLMRKEYFSGIGTCQGILLGIVLSILMWVGLVWSIANWCSK